MSNLIGILGIIAISMIVMAIVMPEDFYPEDYAQAQRLCYDSGGVEKVEIDVLFHDVKCKNGDYYQFQPNTPKSDAQW